MRILRFDELRYGYGQFGEHPSRGVDRQRGDGVGHVLGWSDLGRDRISVAQVVSRFRDTLEGRLVPTHRAWPIQRKVITALCELGVARIFALATFDVRPGRDGVFELFDGCHRTLALGLFGEPGLDEARTRLAAESAVPWSALSG